jgi:hypothetical protein
VIIPSKVYMYVALFGYPTMIKKITDTKYWNISTTALRHLVTSVGNVSEHWVEVNIFFD